MTLLRSLAGLRTLALAALCVAALGAPRADALPLDTRFLIDADQSLVAISNSAFYPEFSEFDVHAEDAGNDLISLTFLDVFFPIVDGGNQETFEIRLPGDTFTAIYDPSDGSVVVDEITVQIIKRQNGSVSQQGDFTFDLTTGEQSRPQCGSAGPSTFSGSPLNASTGELTLLENACIFTLGGQPFQHVFQLKLAGVLETVPTSAPEPSAAILLGLGLLGLARARRND